MEREDTDQHHDALADDQVQSLDRLLEELRELEETVDDDTERRQVRETMAIARRLPGPRFVERQIRKYTTRDVAEAMLGSLVFALPLLVEDGVFAIAEWLVRTDHLGVDFGLPVFLLLNVCFVVVLTTAVLYGIDLRDVRAPNPILGLVPRRLVGVLLVSFFTGAFLFFFWGRHLAGAPATRVELVAQLSVVWVAAALGGSLGDILPGESRGYDITIDNLDDIVARED
jgi:uncharacterized membrane protein